MSNEEVSARAIFANSIQDFGDGSDGDFHLASGEVALIEHGVYNI